MIWGPGPPLCHLPLWSQTLCLLSLSRFFLCPSPLSFGWSGRWCGWWPRPKGAGRVAAKQEGLERLHKHPLPLPSHPDAAQPDPNCRGRRLKRSHLLAVHQCAELSLDVVRGSRPRRSGRAGKESGSDGHRHARACPQSTPSVLAARRGAHWGTGWRNTVAVLCMTAL